jgi:hypothetical protein
VKKFILYGRDECHLCETLQAELAILKQNHDFTVDWVDVDQDPALELKYGFYVPVLMHQGAKVCHYHLDQEAFLKIVS